MNSNLHILESRLKGIERRLSDSKMALREVYADNDDHIESISYCESRIKILKGKINVHKKGLLSQLAYLIRHYYLDRKNQKEY